VSLLSCLACQWTLKDNSQWDYNDDNGVPSTIVTKSMNKDQSRHFELRAHAKTQGQHLKSCIKLLLVSLLCLGLWLYAYRTIWDHSDEPILFNNVDNSLFQMRYTSLGAINAFGQVGQNANLYYSIWISLGIGIAIVYEMVLMTHSQWKTTTSCQNELNMVTKRQQLQAFGVEVMMTVSKTQKRLIQEKRSAWYKSLYKLRYRTGIWIAALIASLVVYFSSERYWRNSVYPEAIAAGQVDDGGYDAEVCNVFGDYFTIAMHEYYGFSYPSICARTKASKWTGLICVSLSFCAVLSHYYMHNLVERETESETRLLEEKRDRMQWLEKRRELIPLNIEFFSASVATTLLGCNAVFATAVGGPAPSVGDLYYSSWISFVLMMRITLGCLSDILDEREELALHSLGQDESVGAGSFISLPQTPKSSQRKFLTNNSSFSPGNSRSFMLQKVFSTRIVPFSLPHTPSKRSNELLGSSHFGGLSFRRTSNILEQGAVQEEEASRTKRLTRWASVAMFSFIFLLSALDAALHLQMDALDAVQKYMLICPCVVATVCTIMFLMCLHHRTYELVDNIQVGGFVSFCVSMLWISNLILTLHNESSWAVNEIGEIKMANLYYFTWACVLNCSMLMSVYVKKMLHAESEGLMMILWLAVVKICFIMFGSCCDILLTVQDDCQAAVYGDTVSIFCQRTQIGAVIGFLGMASGFLAAIARYLNHSPSKDVLYTELLLSIFLTVMFAVSLGLITGIGGPGQVVGDLYYGSWLAFFAAMGATAGLYQEIKDAKEDMEFFDWNVDSNNKKTVINFPVTDFQKM